jgi:hypothetical protein
MVPAKARASRARPVSRNADAGLRHRAIGIARWRAPGAYGTVTKRERNRRDAVVSRRWITLLALHSASPVIVVPARSVVSCAPAPRKFGPPESP